MHLPRGHNIGLQRTGLRNLLRPGKLSACLLRPSGYGAQGGLADEAGSR